MPLITRLVTSLLRAAMCLLILPASAAVPLRGPYPEAARDATLEWHFGQAVADPYRWMEDLDSPKTRAFVEAQGAYTESYIKALPQRASLHQRLTQLYRYVRYDTPFMAAGQTYYTMNTGLQNQNVLYRATPGGGREVVLDPNTLSTDGHLAVVGYVLSHDGRYLAYGVSDAGSDWTQWRIRDLKAERDLDRKSTRLNSSH